MSLEGSLETVALPDVLRLLASTTKTGELQVRGEPGASGELRFAGGQLDGFAVGECRDAADALFDLLRVEHGRFSFLDDVGSDGPAGAWSGGSAAPGSGRMVDAGRLDIEPLLAETRDRLAEWPDIVAVVPSLDARVELAPVAPPEGITLRPDEWASVVAIGEGRAVRDVLARIGLAEFAGCKAVRQLVEAGVVTIRELDEWRPADGGEHRADGTDAEVGASDEGYADAADLGEGADLDGVDLQSAEPTGAEPADADGESAGPAGVDGDLDEPATFGGFWTPRHALRGEEPEGGEDGSPSEGLGALDEPAAVSADQEAGEAGDGAVTGEAGDGVMTGEAGEAQPGEAGEAGAPAVTGAPSWQGTVEAAAPDGLADRGPWTPGELASLDSADGDAESSADGDAESSTEEPDSSTEEPDATPEEAEVAEAAAEPEEEPINRGLLLKFLSSVRS